MSRANIARGRWGEDLVARWYERQGYEVLDRNWRCEHGELDLVVARDGFVAFCEVKARRSDAYGLPAEAVGRAKQRRLRLLAAAWLRAHPGPSQQVRFDVACVLGTRLDVIEGAF